MLQSVIIDLIQEITLMKNLNLILDNTSTLYVGKNVLIIVRNLILIGIQKSYSNRNEKVILKPLIQKKLLFNKKCFYCKKLKHMIKYYKTKLVAKVNCHCPGLGLTTKTRAWKNSGRKCNP
jgi:hypothetical protein